MSTQIEPTPEQFSQWLAEAMRSVSGAGQALAPRGLTGLVAGEVARLAFAAGAAAAADHVPVVKESLTAAPAKEWQWYTYCPEDGVELYPNRQQAQSAAQSIMGSYEVAAHSDGWHEDMELVSWGALVPVENAKVVARKPADPGGDFDEWVRYELRPSTRWGNHFPDAKKMVSPAPAPAGGEVVAADHVPGATKMVGAVAVTERLPGPEDCDAEGSCWLWTTDDVDGVGHWSYSHRDWAQEGDVTHWLPAHALPLPSGEVEA